MDNQVIFVVLDFLKKRLNDFFETMRPGNNDDRVDLGNIAFSDPFQTSGSLTAIQNRIVITMVNLEEEKTLKNTPHQVPNTGDKGYTYQNPPVFLNLYVLFSANYERYDNALKFISDVIAFFQKNRVFTSAAFPQLVGIDRVIVDLNTLTFEQMNHLWAVLGGKYIPSVLYKVRLIEVQFDAARVAPLIETVDAHSDVKFN